MLGAVHGRTALWTTSTNHERLVTAIAELHRLARATQPDAADSQACSVWFDLRAIAGQLQAFASVVHGAEVTSEQRAELTGHLVELTEALDEVAEALSREYQRVISGQPPPSPNP